MMDMWKSKRDTNKWKSRVSTCVGRDFIFHTKLQLSPFSVKSEASDTEIRQKMKQGKRQHLVKDQRQGNTLTTTSFLLFFG